MINDEVVPSPEAALYLGSRTVNVGVNTTTATKLLSGNGNRVCIILQRDGSVPTSANGATLTTGPTSSDLAFAQITGALPYIVLNVKDFGPLVTGEIWSKALSADGFVTITEIFRTR